MFVTHFTGACPVAVFVATMAGLLTAAEPGIDMPTAKQNALVRQYCAVCHTDEAQNGGLSLEHFDAATAAPSLAAMLLSKLTGGVALETVRETRTNARAASLVYKSMSSGAMGGAGIPLADQATIG